MIKVDGFEMAVEPIIYFYTDDSPFVRSVVHGWTVSVTETVATPIGDRVTSWRLDMSGDEMKLTNEELCDRVRTFAEPKVVWRYR